jgi:hypothetical protein
MKKFLSNRAARAAFGVGLVAAFLGFSAPAFATTDTAIASGFTTAQTDLLGYLALAIVLVIAVMVVGLGITLLVKWARRAVHST